MSNQIKLYTEDNDVLCHRTRIALAIKGVDYQTIIVNPDNPPAELAKINPYKTTPTILDGENGLYSSCIINEYLNDKYPYPPLLPVNPLARARLRLMTQRVEQGWLSYIYAIYAIEDEDEIKQLKKDFLNELAQSASLFKASKYFLNPEFSIADCLIAAILWRTESLGLDLSDKKFKPINDYMYKVFNTPFFIKSLTKEEKKLRTDFVFDD